MAVTKSFGESVFDVHCYPTHSYDTEASVEVYETSVPNPKYTIDDGVRRLGQLCVPIPDVARGKCHQSNKDHHDNHDNKNQYVLW
jgi:hypothetical protein